LPVISTPSENIKINWITLAFPKKLELAFLDQYFHDSLWQVRIASALGIFFYGIFGFLDAALVPDAKHQLWYIRYGIVCPFLFVTCLFSFSRHFKKYMQLSIASTVLAGGFGIIAMIVIAPSPASYSYYAGLILVFIYGYTFFRLRFIWATLTGWAIVFAYEITAIWLSPTPVPTLINNNFFFLTGNVFGMFTGYSIEYYLRRDFIQARLLEVEKKKVAGINLELEERVKERTTQLVEANRELMQEITERRRAEKDRRYLEFQLRKSQKMEAIGTLAGGVAHDLNNILSGLVSYPELLLMDLPEDSPLVKPILTIKESGHKAAAIVQDLLTLARRGVSITDVINLNQLIEEYLNSPENKKILEYHPKVRIVTHLEKNPLNILGSPVHLSKTIMNLVSNAAEAMPDGGEIRITTENRYIDCPIKGHDTIEEGDYLILTVSDNGTGIPVEDIDRIFEPFYTKKTMGRSGTGLGMAVVWGTIKDHNGFIDVQSEMGKGTTFTLYFPVTRKRMIPEKPKSTEEFFGHGESILVVDDIQEQREIASSMLEKMGYKAVSVPSGEEALDYLKEHSADLLLLDMIMIPGMDGLETYKKILQFNPDQKAVIASGYSESKRVKAAQKMGAGAYVKKPYSFEKIGLAIKAELNRQN
jgi:signal transduction histidine kinase/ActR/RegA family two-component response regulator